MKATRLQSLVEGGVMVVFLLLAGAFLLNLWGHYAPPAEIPTTPAVFSNPTTVRLTVQELIDASADTSGQNCYSCHEEGKVRELKYDANGLVTLPAAHQDLIYSRLNCAACHDGSEKVELTFNAEGQVVIPPAHQGLVLRHGQSNRNNDCFNCHVSTNLTTVKTANGQHLPLVQSTLLCANCHGPTFRDWEAGIHGRLNGYWKTEAGERKRKECASCHDPHAPAFPFMKPGPAPRHKVAAATSTHPIASSHATEP